jgi:ribulose-5-phosphate 4-epimerase/fuculose-1-phosphate aldolase
MALVATYHCVTLSSQAASGSVSLLSHVRLAGAFSNGGMLDPYSIHFGLLKASDFVLVDEQGRAVLPAQQNVEINRAGIMIHTALHKARPDVNAAVHTHSPYGRAWSAFGRGVEMLNQGTSQIDVSGENCLD